MRKPCGELVVTSIVARPLAALALAGAVAAPALSLPAAAQDRMTSETAPRLEAQRDQVAAFDIPAQALGQALTALGRQSGLQVAFDPAAAAGKISAAVSGSMTAEQALRQLLGGSGLSYQFTSARAVTVSGVAGSTGAMQLDPVQVQGQFPVPSQATIDNLPPPYAGGQVATGGQLGILGERGFMDTPFNQSNYTSQLIKDQQARSVMDVLANDSSVRNTLSSANYAAVPFVRGFTLSNQDYAFNGMYSVAPQMVVSPEYLERVELLKGPGVLLNGMPPFGSIGGVLNLVPKRAGDEPLNSATATFASGAQVGGNVDFARRFGDDKQFGVRFNGVYRNGSTPVDRQSQEVGAAVMGMDFRGERLRVSLDYGYQKQRYNAPLGFTYVAAGVPVPLAPGGHSNWFQPWTYMDSADIFGVAKAEYDIAPDWTIYGAAGGRSTRLESVRGGVATIIDSASNLTETALYRPSYAAVNTEEVGVRGKAQTGPIDHLLSLSATRIFVELGQGDSPVLASVRSNLYQPTFVAQPQVTYRNPPKVSATELSSLALADVLSAFDNRAQLILGARLQRIRATNFSAVSGAVTSSFDQSALSPAVGVVVKPWRNVSIYGNYVQGMQQGPTAPAAARNSGQVFQPVVSTQFELGAKVDFGQFAATLAAFQVDQPFGVTNPSTSVFSVDGMQRNQGLEFNVFGEPLPGFRPLGGITLMNGVQLSTASSLTTGRKMPGVPDVQLNLGAEWDASFLRGLTFAGRLIYTSLQYLDTANTQSIPSWTRFDAGVRYSFERKDGKPIEVRFNVENLFDLNYWASASVNNGLAMGTPRTFLLSLGTRF
jgi:iron complex outermembrane receptor protein